MSPERTQAYRRVLSTLDDLGPAKLQDDEQDRIRTAADTLLFVVSPDDDAAREAIADIEDLCRALVDSGRWEPVTADALAADVRGCGPGTTPDIAAAA